MSTEDIIEELEVIRASSALLNRRAVRLITMLQPVSTGRSKKKGLDAEEITKLLDKKNRRLYKKSTHEQA